MIEFLQNILTTIFVRPEIATIIVSMFPIIELKGAIPIGMSKDFWGVNALSSSQAFLCSLIGSCLIVPILALVFKPIINWMKSTKLFHKLVGFIEGKIAKSSSKIERNSQKTTNSRKKIILKMLGIFVFVADPFPFTGVWTGTCIGIAIGLNFWQTVISVILGNVVSGLLVMFVCSAFPQFTTIVFFVMIGIIAAILLTGLIKCLLKRINKPDLSE